MLDRIYTPVALAYSARLKIFEICSIVLILLFSTLPFTQPASACNGASVAYLDWIKQRHAMDAEIPRKQVSYDPEQGVYKVMRENEFEPVRMFLIHTEIVTE